MPPELKITTSLEVGAMFPDITINNDTELNSSSNIEAIIDSVDARASSRDIAMGIHKTFSSPPSLDRLKSIIGDGSKNLLRHIIVLFQLHGFMSDKEHIDLLVQLKPKLNNREMCKYYMFMSYVYDRRKEYSLELECFENALQSYKGKDKELILNLMIGKGAALAKLKHPSTEATHQKIYSYAKKHHLTRGLSWCFHNWGEYLWRQGRTTDAMLLFHRETDYRREEGEASLARHYGFLAEKLEFDQPMEAIDLYRKVLGVGTSLPRGSVAEANYRIACLGLRYNLLPLDDVLLASITAYDLFCALLGQEARAAWSAGIIAICYGSKGDKQNESKFLRIKENFLTRFGDEKERFKHVLGEVLSKQGDNDIELSSLECVASRNGNEELYLDWIISTACNRINGKKYTEAIDLIDYALSTVIPKVKNRTEKTETISILYHEKAICLGEMGDLNGNLECLRLSLNSNPSDYKVRWSLCNNLLVAGEMELAKEHAEYLLRHKPLIAAPYQALSRIYVHNGNIDAAIDTLRAGVRLLPENNQLKTELSELSDIKFGIIQIHTSYFYKHYSPSSLHGQKVKTCTYHSLPEIETLSDFYGRVIRLLPNFIYQLEKTPPKYLRDFRKTSKVSFEESDFRDELERHITLAEISSSAEVKHGDGRTDLIIQSMTEPLVNKAILEFKIWPRNDYKSSVNQLIQYSTSFQEVGVIFMINTAKGSIDDKYVDEIIFQTPNYVPGSFRKNPLCVEIPNFFSKHMFGVGKCLKIFHFIFNCKR